jgi:glycerophosphoryl diester phosphodiesterase
MLDKQEDMKRSIRVLDLKLVELMCLFLLMVTSLIIMPSPPSHADTLCTKMGQSRPVLIAHAGGAIRGLTYTNSKEALDGSYERGHRYFEIDLNWSADQKVVAVHDWDQKFNYLFNKEVGFWNKAVNLWITMKFRIFKGYHFPDTHSFKSLRMRQELTQLVLSDLLKWMEDHPDAFIITDFKEKNIKGLKRLAEEGKSLAKQFIPQIYDFSEYRGATKLGFKQIIFTLYLQKENDQKVVQFGKNHALFGITMPVDKALTTPIAQQIYKETKTVVFAHTVNDQKILRKLRTQGVCGVYTDNLIP